MTIASKNSGLVSGTSSDITYLVYHSLQIRTLSGKDFDISSNIIGMSYFENILEASVTMELQIVSSTSVFNTLDIRGGETVTMEIETAMGNFEIDDTNPMYVYKVSNLSTTTMGESFTLHLVSREFITNETSRCMRKHGDQNVHEHVKDILTNELKTDRFNDDTIESAVNKYTFMGNSKKPFHVLQWLGPKSISSAPGPKGNSGGNGSEKGEAKGTAGFLFFENKDGFNFRSLDRLVSSSSKPVYEYTYSQVIEETTSKLGTAKILKYFYEHNVDLRRALRVGMYSNYTYFYDMKTNQLSGFQYKLEEQLGPKLGTEDKIAVHPALKDSISRVMFRISDHGVLDAGGGDKESGRDAVDMAKSYSRYNLLFSQALNILVPINVNLKVGDVVECKLPLMGGSEDAEYDKEMSGNYLIRELRHTFTANQNTTSLKLMRDSYGLYGPQE